MKQYEKGQLTLKTGCDAEQTLETEMKAILNQIREAAGNFCFKNLPKTNSALRMAVCGSKGSNLNLSQMISCVGQQAVTGERIPDGFNNRSLPHFEIYSKAPKAKGFVQNSFYTGLEPYEFFFHTMAGREGLIDTAVKTADTGYMQRRLIKALEDVVVGYDGSVRNSEGCIIQFLYGDDGLDPIQCESAEMPFDLDRLLAYARSFSPCQRGEKGLSSAELEIEVEKRSNRFQKENVIRSYHKEKLDQFFLGYKEKIISIEKNLGVCYNISIGITLRQVRIFFKIFKEKMNLARVCAGEGVGAISAQSIGEPCTQMTLKTFHFAGVASMNVTLGVPRIKEIINAATNIQTPIIEVKLKNNQDPVVAKMVKNEISTVRLSEVAESISEIYEPSGCYLEVKISREMLEKKYINISIEDVKNGIIQGKFKLKDKNLKILSNFKLRVEPYDTSEREMIFILKVALFIIIEP